MEDEEEKTNTPKIKHPGLRGREGWGGGGEEHGRKRHSDPQEGESQGELCAHLHRQRCPGGPGNWGQRSRVEGAVKEEQP